MTLSSWGQKWQTERSLSEHDVSVNFTPQPPDTHTHTHTHKYTETKQ